MTVHSEVVCVGNSHEGVVKLPAPSQAGAGLASPTFVAPCAEKTFPSEFGQGLAAVDFFP